MIERITKFHVERNAVSYTHLATALVALDMELGYTLDHEISPFVLLT